MASFEISGLNFTVRTSRSEAQTEQAGNSRPKERKDWISNRHRAVGFWSAVVSIRMVSIMSL